MDDFLFANIDEFRRLLGKAGLLFIKIMFKIPIKYRQKLHIRILDWLGGKKGKYIAELWGNITCYSTNNVVNGDEVEVLFEDCYFPTYPQYRVYLENSYGNYMQLPPEEQRKGHGDSIIIDLENDYSEYMDFESNK